MVTSYCMFSIDASKTLLSGSFFPSTPMPSYIHTQIKDLKSENIKDNHEVKNNNSHFTCPAPSIAEGATGK